MAKLRPFQPARNLTETYNAVNPDLPLEPGDARYVDFSPWRGGENIAEIISQRIIRANGNEPIQHLKPLVAGHRGCGKSTELLLLKERLEAEDYFVVYFDAVLALDMNDVDYADILLATMHQLEAEVRESPLKLKLDENRLDELAMRLAPLTIESTETTNIENKIESEFRLSPQIPFFAKVMAAIRSVIKSGSDYKEKLRREVKQRTTQFLQDLNDLIDELQIQLHNCGKKGLVIIIDSLEKILLNELNSAGRRTTHSAIYLEHEDHLKAPRCHIIYTVPISIYFHENLDTVYPDMPLIIPMIKIREANGAVCQDGLDIMHKAIAQRIDIAQVFEEEGNIEKLCFTSGGHIRDLMHLMRYACDYSKEKITPTAVNKAMFAMIRKYDRLVKDEDLQRLVKVHREKRSPSDKDYARLLYHLIVLEYQNDERWADVHPAVQETRKFREALADEEPKSRSGVSGEGQNDVSAAS